MAKATFTNEQLCRVWAKQAKAGGTRANVVRELLALIGVEDNADNYRKMYNNVTQRHKQLSTHSTNPVQFPELTAGKKGAKRSVEQMVNLQAIVNEEYNAEQGEVDGADEVDDNQDDADDVEDDDVEDDDVEDEDDDDDDEPDEPAF